MKSERRPGPNGRPRLALGRSEPRSAPAFEEDLRGPVISRGSQGGAFGGVDRGAVMLFRERHGRLDVGSLERKPAEHAVACEGRGGRFVQGESKIQLLRP